MATEKWISGRMLKLASRDESGQSTVLMLVIIVALIGAAGFSVEGMRIYAERRSVQNAADAAALAGALALCDGSDPIGPAINRAADNGYAAGDSTDVLASAPPTDGAYSGAADYIQIRISSRIPTTFLAFIYSGQLEASAEAIGHCNFHRIGAGAAIFAGSDRCQNTLQWAASQTQIDGNVHSNHDLHIAGGDNWVNGAVRYVNSLEAVPGNVTFVPGPPTNPSQVALQPYPVSFQVGDYAPGGDRASLADSLGEYISCNCDIDTGWLEDNGYFDPATNRLARGLYFAGGSVHLSGDGLIGPAVTFVAQEGIALSNSNHQLEPYIDGLLLFSGERKSGGAQCNSPVIQLSGSSHQWSGLIYAPGGLIRASGANNVALQGSLIGYTTSLAGSGIYIEYDPVYLSPPPPSVQLAQ